MSKDIDAEIERVLDKQELLNRLKSIDESLALANRQRETQNRILGSIERCLLSMADQSQRDD